MAILVNDHTVQNTCNRCNRIQVKLPKVHYITNNLSELLENVCNLDASEHETGLLDEISMINEECIILENHHYFQYSILFHV